MAHNDHECQHFELADLSQDQVSDLIRSEEIQATSSKSEETASKSEETASKSEETASKLDVNIELKPATPADQEKFRDALDQLDKKFQKDLKNSERRSLLINIIFLIVGLAIPSLINLINPQLPNKEISPAPQARENTSLQLPES